MKRRRPQPSRTGNFNISEVAQIVGVSASTLRMWEKVGLIAPERSRGGYRLFSTEDVEKLKQIKSLKSTQNLNVGGVVHVLSQNGRKPPAADNGSQSKAIGEKLRSLRAQQEMTLKEVAEATELSVGFLSSLERSQTNASIATLQRLAKFYNTNFLSFFDDTGHEMKLIRPEQRKVLETQPGARIELLAVGQTMMESQLWTVAPGVSSGGSYHHEGEEFIYVLQGKFEIWLDELEHYVLRQGDSLYFSSSQAHRWTNPGKRETKLLWINTPPTF